MAVEVLDNVFKLLLKLTIIMIVAMFLKVVAYRTLSLDFKGGLVYNESVVINKDDKFNKPFFNNQRLNQKINEYIIDNKCSNLNYDVMKISKHRINVYLDCGKPASMIYNSISNKIENIKVIVKDEKAFKKDVKRLLDLKYPKYISKGIDVYNGVYDIKPNKIIAYYDDASITINNNEIKDLMKYTMVYDSEYTNEEFKPDPNKKTIAFSFDDGPSEYDKSIIDALKEYHATATFFLVGNRINAFADAVKYMDENKMEVGNHSYDHAYLPRLSEEEILNQINSTNNEYKNITGKDMGLIRPPYGAINSKVKNTLDKPLILWNIDTLDWQSKNTDMVYESIINDVKDGDIILMHSLYPTTRDAVIKVLPVLYEMGYQVVDVSTLMSMKNVPLEAHKAYRSS